MTGADSSTRMGPGSPCLAATAARRLQVRAGGRKLTDMAPEERPIRQPPEPDMLVTFKTQAHANITMFGDVAVTLIKLMGHSGTVPGALMPEDIPAALARLEAAVAANPDADLDPGGAGGRDDEEGEHVSLAHRAFPLIELLRAAAEQEKHVMWES